MAFCIQGRSLMDWSIFEEKESLLIALRTLVMIKR